MLGKSFACPTLCDPMDYIAHGILQARILKWVAVPFSRGPDTLGSLEGNTEVPGTTSSEPLLLS